MATFSSSLAILSLLFLSATVSATKPPAYPPVKPPAVAPVKPPANPPVKPPAFPPVKPPAVAPVKPPANPPIKPPAPVKPPALPPVKPPAVAPIKPPAFPPVKPPAVAPVKPPAFPPVKPPALPPVKPPTFPPVKPPVAPPAPRLHLIVEGVVYCKSSCQYAGKNTVWGGFPLHGATVKLVCNNTGQGAEVTATTDIHGFFYVEAPKCITQVRSCRVKLDKSPSPDCPVPSALHRGNTGSRIHPRPLNVFPGPDFKPVMVFEVGPFTFEPKCKL